MLLGPSTEKTATAYPAYTPSTNSATVMVTNINSTKIQSNASTEKTATAYPAHTPSTNSATEMVTNINFTTIQSNATSYHSTEKLTSGDFTGNSVQPTTRYPYTPIITDAPSGITMKFGDPYIFHSSFR